MCSCIYIFCLSQRNLHNVCSRTFVCFPFEVHGSFCVWNGAVLFIPVIIFNHRWNPIWVHQDVTAQKRRFHMPIHEPIQLKIFVVITERIDQLFSNLKVGDKNLCQNLHHQQCLQQKYKIRNLFYSLTYIFLVNEVVAILFVNK